MKTVLKHLIAHCTKQTIKKGDYLCMEGDPMPHKYFVARGAFISSILDAQGTETVYNLYARGEWITDYASFYTGVSCATDIRCIQDAELYCLSKDTYDKLVQNDMYWVTVSLTTMQAEVLKREGWQKMLRNPDMVIRIQWLHQNHPRYFKSIPKKYLARFLNMAPETFSRCYTRHLDLNQG